MAQLGYGNVYSGPFTANEMSGENGRLVLFNGDLLSGTFERGLLNGDGLIEYASGDVFRGKFVKGMRVKGEFRSKAMSYTGEWVNDSPHGERVRRNETLVFADMFFKELASSQPGWTALKACSTTEHL